MMLPLLLLLLLIGAPDATAVDGAISLFTFVPFTNGYVCLLVVQVHLRMKRLMTQ